MFRFRPNTMDAWIYRQVVTLNEYKLPPRLEASDVIIDIGAHIGSFSYAAWLRGSRNIRLFEAHPENMECILSNLADCGGITGSQVAVWRSDVTYPLTLGHTGFDAVPAGNGDTVYNTGGGNVLWTDIGDNLGIPAVPLDDIILGYDREIRLVKIDAETSEFPILLTSRTLSFVREIVGEFHEVGGRYNTNYIPEHASIPGITEFTIEVLSEHLARYGFDVTHTRFMADEVTPSNMGYFRAVRHV